MGYLKDTIKGVSWISLQRISSRLVAFLRVIFLARILSPTQFGLFGIATLVLSFLEILTETGVNVVLIQKKESIDSYVDAAWLVSIIRGFFIFVFVFLSSSLIGIFFHAPQATRLLMLISIVPLIRGFINPSVVKYQKELQFKKEFFYRFAIYAFDSLTVIVFALILKDASSFVYGLIAGALLELILSFLLIGPRPQIIFQFEKIKDILHHGKWVTLFGIFNYLAQEGDTVVVGKILDVSSLGIYQMGYRLSTLPISEISDVVNRVVFPVYTKIAQDRKRLQRAFKKTSYLISVATVVMCLVLFFLPKDFFVFVLGAKWVGVADIFKILVLYGMLRAISGTTASLFLAVGKQKYVATVTFLRFVILAGTIVPFTLQYGLIGASFSVLLSVLIELPLIGYYVYRVLR